MLPKLVPKPTLSTSMLLLLLAATASSHLGDFLPCHHPLIFVDATKITSLGSIVGGGRQQKSGGLGVAISKTRASRDEEDDDGDNDNDERRSVPDLSSLECSIEPTSASASLATMGTTPACPPESHSPGYGVDWSFPIHHPLNKDTRGGDETWRNSHADFYDGYMAGCRRMYANAGYRLCDTSEEIRMGMNLRQPPDMTNYTAQGFTKVRAPVKMMAQLAKFWAEREYVELMDILPNESWDPGNTYVNHWSAPTKMLHMQSSHLRRAVWDASHTVLEQWTHAELIPSSLYGARVYTNGSVLAPHVDRMPLVISAVINIAQDVDEPWPLEVYGHDGRAYNVTMEVGDMILYEGHSVVHGRPFPLKGRYFANVFVHFEPLGHTLLHEEQHYDEEVESLEYLYHSAWKKLKSKCVDDEECRTRVDLNVAASTRVPHYIQPGSEEERRWLQTHPKAKLSHVTTATTSSSGEYGVTVRGLTAHTAASSGDMDAIIAIANTDPQLIKVRDVNGWTPLHEAARGGHLEIVKFLISSGLDKDARTHDGVGGSPLWWAKKAHGTEHPVIYYLESIGALDIPPDSHKKIAED